MATLVQEIIRAGKNGPRSERYHSRATIKDRASHEQTDNCVHELFETQVERNPEALALIFGDQQFTYHELNVRANQLARFLKRFGVGPNSLVGLCVRRCPEMVVGVLGILKAGGAYVPLDPSQPDDRVAFILEDSNVFLLLTQSDLIGTIPRHDGPRLSLDADWDVVAKERKTNPTRRASPRNLAYVIHTSGSGGDPKGVMISHRGLLNYLSWGAEAYEVAKGANAIVDSSISLDLAITRILSLLMFGRSIFLEVDAIDYVEMSAH
jgi:non-ribosomal peptide synthetase component F